jgi:predicted RNase H-like HicB family nuclease
MHMDELVFEILQESDGGYSAECLTENIFTQADSWDDLRQNVREAVTAFFFDRPIPASIRLHLVRDEVLSVEKPTLRRRANLTAPKKVLNEIGPMLNITKDIQSLATLGRRSGEFLKQLKKSKRPVVLTVKGKAVIVQDAEAYQRLLDIAARAEAEEGIRQGLEDTREGSVRPAREFFDDFEEARDGIRRKRHQPRGARHCLSLRQN